MDWKCLLFSDKNRNKAGFSGCFAGLFFFLSTHVLPAEDVRFGYGIVLTFVGMALVVGMPLAGFVTDFFGTVRGAFIFSSIVFFISVLLELIIGIRDVCLKKSSTIKVIQPEVNTVFNTDEDL